MRIAIDDTYILCKYLFTHYVNSTMLSTHCYFVREKLMFQYYLILPDRMKSVDF